MAPWIDESDTRLIGLGIEIRGELGKSLEKRKITEEVER
jgi:hypothetical protein